MTKTFDLVITGPHSREDFRRDQIAWDGDVVPALAVLPDGRLATKSGRWLAEGNVYAYQDVRHVLDLRGETPVISTTDEFMQPEMIPSLASLTPEERAKLDEMMADMPRNFGAGLIMPSTTPKEAWFYDVASRTIFDENRLAVARDVGPDDAQTILKALGCEVDFAIVGAPQPNPLFQILDELLAYEDQAFEDDEEIDGGDLVEFWADHRQRLRSALAYNRPQPLTAIAAQAAKLFREYEAHHRAKASEAGRPEKAARNAAIAGRLEAVLDGSVAYGPVLTKGKYQHVAQALLAASKFIESEVENRGAAGGEMTDYLGEAEQAFQAVQAGIAAFAED